MKRYFSCVVDNKPIFYWQCHIFVSSLLYNCGVNPQDIFVHTIDPSPLFLQYLKKLRVNIVFAEKWGDGKYCNKLAQFSTQALLDAKYIFICDTDLAFVDSIDEICSSGTITAKKVDLANPPLEDLNRIFERYKFRKPPQVDTYNGPSYLTNCNGGLYGMPSECFLQLGEAWKKNAKLLLNDDVVLGLLGDKRIHIDQISFSMAMSELEFNFEQLNIIYNTPIHLEMYKDKILFDIKDRKPKVLHYHRELDSCGKLKYYGLPIVDESIIKVNTLLDRVFNNQLFWDLRYTIDPALGSGIGSRGEVKKMKMRILKIAGVESAASVLDVGCGDGEVVKGLHFKNYTGIDISAEALRLHKINNPMANLLLFREKNNVKAAEVVICLDVLLHQTDPRDYYELIQFIAEKTQKRLIVSGYASKDKLDKSCMCVFHEGLRASLEQTGKFVRIFKLAQYRNLDVFVAETGFSVEHHSSHPNDISDQTVFEQLSHHPMRELLLENIFASRLAFGWHTKQLSRIFEYPWILFQLGYDLRDRKIAEFGAGISPLPLLLSMRGAEVYTYDHGPEVHLGDIANKNEWGFFNFAALDPSITSINKTLSLELLSANSMDVWYSVSVVEHIPKSKRLEVFKLMQYSLKQKGMLFLTVDLYKNSYDLWNYSMGIQVEDATIHGTLQTLQQELIDLGFMITISITKSMPDSERIDVAFIAAQLVNKTLERSSMSTIFEQRVNLDIGGQNNRNDMAGLWKIVDLHDGADIKINLEVEPLPLSDKSVDNIYSSHCIEHLEPDKLRNVFSEMFRVLKDGGKIRIVVPDFVKGAYYYFLNPEVLWQQMMPRLNSNIPDTKMSRLSSWFYTETNKINGTPGHKTAWDFELLRIFMEEAGFMNIRETGVTDCSEIFKGKDNPQYEPFSLYVEGEKQKVASTNAYDHIKQILNLHYYFPETKSVFVREKIARDIRLIEDSKLFDSPWYLFSYHDVWEARVEPIKHYICYGWREGRDPSGLFSTREYLVKHPELIELDECPLVHYIRNRQSHNSDLNKIIPKQVLDLIAPINFTSVYELGNKKSAAGPYAHYYRAIGIEYSSIDLNKLDGAIPFDLEKPIYLPPRDAVMNIGTSEHIHKQYMVFRNIHTLSRSRMMHWVPVAGRHPTHGYWGYTIDFFNELAWLNSYIIEKIYIETSFTNWTLLCCSFKKRATQQKNFCWTDSLLDKLTYNHHGLGGISYE